MGHLSGNIQIETKGYTRHSICFMDYFLVSEQRYSFFVMKDLMYPDNCFIGIFT
jgi:hypothetical protein